jgi:hypothetical protein
MTLQVFQSFVSFCLLQVLSQNTAVMESQFPLVVFIRIRQKKTTLIFAFWQAFWSFMY